jgi:hypothetical protein
MAKYNRATLSKHQTIGEEGAKKYYEVTSFPADVGITYKGGTAEENFDYTRSPFCMAFFMNVTYRALDEAVAPKNRTLYDIDLRRGGNSALNLSRSGGTVIGTVVGAAGGAALAKKFGTNVAVGAVAGAAAGGIAGGAADALGVSKGLSDIVFATRKRLAETIILPMPMGLEFADNTSYGEAGIGGSLGTLLNAGANVASMRDAAGAGGGAGMQLLLDSMKYDLNEALAGKGRSRGIGEKFGITNMDGVIDKAVGAVNNPRLEQVFKGKEFRKFSFVWQLAPRNEQESESIRTIIKKFRMHMTPEVTDHLGGAFLVMPDEFDIVFYKIDGDPETNSGAKFTENTNIPKIATCVMTDFNVDYQPNNHWSSFADGSVGHYVIKIAFKEVEPIYRKQIEDGF